ncbi:MAG: phosphoglycerate dehydrogenase [Cyclobacteriaceae bacterium]|nr:phosphoglycerate dehydrogenase [Cyclobacteriaceae bacterium]
MYKIQTLNKIAEEGLSRFPTDKYTLDITDENPDAIIVRSASLHEMEFSANTKTIARAGAGVNNIPLNKCTEQGIVVFNTPGANANAVKELVIAAMLISSRRITDGINWTKSLKGKGDEVKGLVEKGKSNFKGPEIYGKTLGVIGLGAIGMLVANAAEALGMRVIGFDPYISIDSAWQLSKNVEKARSLDALLSEADYISLHVPLMDGTKEFIDASKFAVMKDGVRLMNFARGGLVNKDDLLVALDSGKVGAFITDFPQDRLLDHDNIIPVPHLGASTPESETNCAIMAVDQIREYLENGNIKNSVNFPAADMPRNGGPRIIIANKNIPAMVGKITAVLAERNINIEDMLNQHRGDIAYNIIDVDQVVSEEDVEKIRGIEGVILVRVL